MFENLTARLQEAFSKLRKKGKLSEADVDEALREIRIALLEADVNFKVVKDFIEKVRDRAVGSEVATSLTPGQQVIKIVNSELTQLMGGRESKISYASKPPTIIMIVGLQGSGKTTTAAKLGYLMKKQGRKPLLIAADTWRPAAVKQLQVLGDIAGVEVFTSEKDDDAIQVVSLGIDRAKFLGCDLVVVDTRGRLHIDDELMAELDGMKRVILPHEILLVVDAMTGQDAVNVASGFDERLEISGVILTKLDGDARGGAALSTKAVTGKPIKFVGTGEKIDALEPFYPDRMASRILGMGDILSLIERAEAGYSRERAARLGEKLKTADFTLEDFQDQLKHMQKLGPLDEVIRMIPGMGRVKGLRDMKVDERRFRQIEAIINSMTPDERRNPGVIDGSRRRRIARGSGVKVQDVNLLLRQFNQVKGFLKQLGGAGKAGRRALRKGMIPFMQ